LFYFPKIRKEVIKFTPRLKREEWGKIVTIWAKKEKNG
jgi:hypothetical protein